MLRVLSGLALCAALAGCTATVSTESSKPTAAPIAGDCQFRETATNNGYSLSVLIDAIGSSAGCTTLLGAMNNGTGSGTQITGIDTTATVVCSHDFGSGFVANVYADPNSNLPGAAATAFCTHF